MLSKEQSLFTPTLRFVNINSVCSCCAAARSSTLFIVVFWQTRDKTQTNPLDAFDKYYQCFYLLVYAIENPRIAFPFPCHRPSSHETMQASIVKCYLCNSEIYLIRVDSHKTPIRKSSFSFFCLFFLYELFLVGVMWDSCGSHAGVLWDSCGSRAEVVWES